MCNLLEGKVFRAFGRNLNLFSVLLISRSSDKRSDWSVATNEYCFKELLFVLTWIHSLVHVAFREKTMNISFSHFRYVGYRWLSMSAIFKGRSVPVAPMASEASPVTQF
jgi:hypothetical protein